MDNSNSLNKAIVPDFTRIKTDRLPTTDRDWAAVVASAICLIFSVGTLQLYGFGVFIRPLSTEFSWSRTQLSGAVAIGQYALAISAPFWGLLTDRFGPRRIVVTSVITLSVGVASLGLLTPNIGHIYLIFALIPLIGGGASPLGYAAILVRRFDRRLGLALGLALMGVGFGATILPPLTQWLVDQYGWRAAYGLLGLTTLLVTVPAALVATRAVRGSVHRSAMAKQVPLSFLLTTSAFLRMCLVFVLLGIVSVGTLAHLVPMMTDRGFTPAQAARIAGLTGLAAIASRSGIGWLLDRTFAPRVLAAVALVAGVAFGLLTYGPGAPSSYGAVLLLGVVIGAEVDFIAYLIRRYFGPAAFGRLYGIAFGLFIVGSGTGPLLLGISFDRFGGYRLGLLVFGALSLLATLLAWFMPNYPNFAPTTADE